ncbi:translesion error-prone DNA polymerase V autoproteolytic subunit [Polaromonas sp.]|uniref:LexA family protein n=1 Tax=Polaromonas sp. TaxID=1869339 RepID=UPI0013B79ACC|nr:translesion error-prone DNA polymerase V autoproteolytic subunit [Polaromonas sp.]NDP63083.1 translesion error-prone DNA polymerase V autoproteolytic subunit [Polaromonas sp.]
MHGPAPEAIPAACHPPRLTLAMVEGRIPAGFPSPADDFALKGLDLNDLLITHPLATFFMQVSGWSLVLEHICDQDIVVVNRALTPRHGHVVVALVDNQFTIKILHRQGGCIKLMPANPEFGEMVFQDGQELVIIGVVTASIRRRLAPRSLAECHGARDAGQEDTGQEDAGPRAAGPFGR